jgi:tryptophan synthase alpha chain
MQDWDMTFSSKALIPYITAGLPDLETTRKALLMYQETGCAAAEIGVPYSDPVADGPVIAEAGYHSLARGTNLDDLFKMLKGLKGTLKIPVYLMSYYSPVYTYGEDKFISECASSGAAGSIVPDLSLDEGRNFFQKQKEAGLDPVLLVFPNTPADRIRDIAAASGSFLYCVNFFGTTGVREIPDSAYERLAEVKRLAGKSVAAGFGVSTKADFDRLRRYGDAVIMASAFMKILLEHEQTPDAALKVIRGRIGEILS